MCSGCVVFHCLSLLLSTNKEILKAHSQSLNSFFYPHSRHLKIQNFHPYNTPPKRARIIILDHHWKLLLKQE
jgi:hypothetical protein